MAYQWTADLATGNILIDNQHKELIRAINSLLDACSLGKGRAEIDSTLNFLQSYVNRHFSDEENLQMKSRYPDITNHKRYHAGFKKSIQDIVAEYQQGGASIAIVAKVNSFAAGLISHIRREDVKVAAHVKKTAG